VEIYEKLRARPMALVLTAVGLALLLVTVLSLSLSARAEPTADLDVSKKVNTDRAAPGETLTYTIHITKNTYTPAALWMTDTLPPEVDYVTDSLQLLGSGSAAVTNDVLTWTVDGFGHSDVIIIYSVEISSAITSATITNTAEVTGTGDLVTSNMVSTGVSPGELQVSKEAGSPSVRPGGQLDYSIYISNIGGGAVSAVSMTDSLPPEVSYASGLNATSGTPGVTGNVITWTGQLNPAGQVTITFTTDVSSTLSEGTCFTNTAFVYGAGLPVSASVAARTVTTFSNFLPLMYNKYPPIPVLDPIPIPQGGTYTITWQCDASEAVVSHYVLQRARDPGFTQDVQEFVTTEKFYPSTAFDVFYFRVRADGAWGQGPWSNVEKFGFYDGFTDVGSGWPHDHGEMYPDHYWWRGYTGKGQYYIKIDQGGPYAWFYQPDAFAPYVPPSDKYCIESNLKYERGNMWANMGIVFGANESNTKYYAMCFGRDNDSGLGWFLMRADGYEFPRRGCSGPTFKIEGFAPGGQAIRAGTSRDGWNRVRIGIDGDKVRVYIGDYYKGEKTMTGLSSMTYIGVIGGDYELTPIDIRYDYFKVIPGSDCSY
jgi:uncharacterized repeat protein (TIGR01451 family)